MVTRRNDHSVYSLRSPCWVAFALFLCLFMLGYSENYTIKQVASVDLLNKEPVVGDSGIVAWYSYVYEQDASRADVYMYKNGQVNCLTEGKRSYGWRPKVVGDKVIWEGVLEQTKTFKIPTAVAGGAESVSTITNSALQAVQQEAVRETRTTEWGICEWNNGKVQIVSGSTSDSSGGQLDENGSRGSQLSVVSPSVWGDTYAWQSASDWPCGWEITTKYKGQLSQLTTNCFYDMEPKVFDEKVVWYGWDGQDFEIYLADLEQHTIIQLTDNNYDDMKPVIWDDMIAWVGYPAVEADIFVYQDEKIRRISDNPNDDIFPRIWNGKVVWQGIVGEDYEIFMYDGEEVHQITDNSYDDIDPDIRDDTICWVGYHDNWDAEVFVQNLTDDKAQMLTDNEYEDRHPRTAAKIVVWEAKREGSPLIFVAEPQ